MRMNLSFMFLILMLCCGGLHPVTLWASEPEHMLIKIETTDPEQYQRLWDFNLDLAGDGALRPNEYMEVIVTPEQAAALTRAGYSYSVLIDSLGDITIDSEYDSYDEVVETIQLYENLYPDIFKVYDIGDSWAKVNRPNDNDYLPHDIWAVKISDNVEVEEDEPAVLFCGLHHAREPITVNMVMEILTYLADEYAENEAVQRYVDNSEIWLIPILNPDGHHLVVTDFDVWWRKNVHDNNNNEYIDDYDGVDPNRNYSYSWENGETDPADPVYHGEAPFSEPENQAIRDLCLEQRPVSLITFHTHGELILYPYSSVQYPAPDEDVLTELAYAMAAINGYQPQQGYELYPTHGDLTDWAYSQLGTLSYTVEMCNQFIPPGSEIQSWIDESFPITTYFMDRALRSKLELHVTDAETGDPVVAEVEVAEIELPETFAPRVTDAQFGRYDRLLSPGDYTVTVSAFGYADTTFTVTIHEDVPTPVDLPLRPLGRGSLEGWVFNVAGGDFPFIEAVTVVLHHPEMTPDTLYAEIGYFEVEHMVAGEYLLEAFASGFDSVQDTVTITAGETLYVEYWVVPVFDFEADDGDFGTETRSEWEWGVPLPSGGPTHAYSGSMCWGIDLDDRYDPNRNSYLYTPEYNMTSDGSGRFGIAFYHWYSTVEGWDGGNVQISVDNGETWTILHPVGGYPDASVVALGGRPGFTGDSNGWRRDYFDLLPYAFQRIMIRFRFSSTNRMLWGWFIDNFAIYGSELYVDVEPQLTTVTTPSQFELYQNVPNPFNPNTTIRYDLPRVANVTLSIYDLAGRLIRQWYQPLQSSGSYTIPWDGTDQAGQAVQSGMYVYQLHTGDFYQTRKMILIR
ncbi:MAG: T9SS C-terminal target domain-containing protein [Gemmatimonadetes bacterium]|nr:MAG: T9SS C-terminal target domain-containing protein [Gemmatimonadota bacterium]